LYDARPKTGKDNFGTPSTSDGYDGTGACILCEPEKEYIFVLLKQPKQNTNWTIGNHKLVASCNN
jgi:hypothetical protein